MLVSATDPIPLFLVSNYLLVRHGSLEDTEQLLPKVGTPKSTEERQAALAVALQKDPGVKHGSRRAIMVGRHEGGGCLPFINEFRSCRCISSFWLPVAVCSKALFYVWRF
jgi:hypothetical protein